MGCCNLLDVGDRVVMIHVQSLNSNPPMKLFGDFGSPLIPLEEYTEMNISKKYGVTLGSEVLGVALIPLEEYTEMNTSKQYGVTSDSEVLDVLDTISRTKKVFVVFKIYWGDPREILCDAVEELKLDSLVVGSRGLGVIKRVLIRNVSNYVVANLTCLVTVVRGVSMSKTCIRLYGGMFSI